MARNGSACLALDRVEDPRSTTHVRGYENLFRHFQRAPSGFPNTVRPSLISYTGHGDTR